MEGYPKILNTKEDYFNMLELDRAETVNRLKQLLNNSLQWQYVRDLDDDEEGITDDFHRIESFSVTSPIPETGEIPDDAVVTRAQFELKHHPTSELFRLGFTVEEVEQLIENNEGLL